MAPAKTGNDNNNKQAVITVAHVNRGNWSNLIFLIFMLIIVVIKLIAPKIEEIPAKCKEKIDKSTEGPEWAILEDKGG